MIKSSHPRFVPPSRNLLDSYAGLFRLRRVASHQASAVDRLGPRRPGRPSLPAQSDGPSSQQCAANRRADGPLHDSSCHGPPATNHEVGGRIVPLQNGGFRPGEQGSSYQHLEVGVFACIQDTPPSHHAQLLMTSSISTGLDDHPSIVAWLTVWEPVTAWVK